MELARFENSECVSPPPIRIKASVLRLKPFVFNDLQVEIHTEKFRRVTSNYAVFTH